MGRKALPARIATGALLAALLLVAGSAGPATSFNPSSDGTAGCWWNFFPYARWAGDAIHWKIGSLGGAAIGV